MHIMSNRNIEWTADLEIGVPIIDDQHRDLIALANTVLSAFGTRSRELVEGTVRQLLSYVQLHFDSELALMHEIGYAGAEDHARQHDAISGHVEDLWAQRDNTPPEELFSLLADWIVHHIRAEAAELRELIV